MNDNNFQQNNNDFYSNNQPSPPQWGVNPQPPYYSGDRMRMQENPAKSPLVPVLVGIIIVLLIAICLVGGYLLGKGKGGGGGNNDLPAATVQTTKAEENAPAETQPPITEAAVTEIQIESATETVTEAATTVQTSVVVSVQVVTEAPKTIFVGDYACDVRVATKSTDLNMRESPTTSAKIIGSIPKDTIVPYYYGGDGSWGIVYYNGKFGYVNMAYISFDLHPSGSYSADYSQYGSISSYAVVNASGGLNMRSYESTDAPILTTIPNGTEVGVYSSYDGWSFVNWGNNNGYVKSEYLKFR